MLRLRHQGRRYWPVRAVRGANFKEAITWLEAQGAATGGTKARVDSRFQKVIFPDEHAMEVYGVLYEACFEIEQDMPAGRYLQKRGLDLNLANKHRAVQWAIRGNFGKDYLEIRARPSRCRWAGVPLGVLPVCPPSPAIFLL